jgi:hypothetical protein
LAKAEKYRYTFKSHEGQTCVVRFDFEGFTGTSTTLVGAARPFVLKEFNTDDEIFKPLRPQMAEMSFIASASGVSIDNFLMDNDDDIIVYFDFGSWTNYWMGFMLQDDFQESWINTNHIITLRATEGIGQLKDVELTESGTELNGRYTPLELIQYAMEQTVQNFSDYKVYSNLFHSSMTDTSTNTGLDQCYVDAKTFQVNPSEYDDSYLALEKINKSWNQTLYMYKGKWIIFRQEELYVPYSENIRGYRQNGASRTSASQRFDALVGVSQSVKPITPEMLRFIQRRTKSDTIQFNFERFDEIVCNGSFSRGDLRSSSSTEKVYDLDLWDWKEGTPGSPTTPTTGSYGRIISYDTNGKLDDQYAYLTQKSTSGNRWLISCGTDVLKNETFLFSIDHRFKTTFAGTATLFTVSFQLVTSTNYYTLDDDGTWYTSNASWTTNYKALQTYYNGTGEPVPTDWVSTQVEAKSIPDDGILYILLWMPDTPLVSGQEKWFKNLQLDVITRFNGANIETIEAVQSIFTKTDTLRPKFFDEIYFDDGLSKLYKGSLYEDDQQTLTDEDWHRYRYSSESFGFRKQNDVAHWSHNRINRNKIDVSFYGLTWSSGSEPIGLINTIRFVDDDPNRIYGIANLKEMDFSSSTWSATLVEVFNMDDDATGSPVNRTLSLTAAGGTAISIINWDVISLADFTANSVNSKFTFAGSTSITTTITCTLQGNTLITTSTPINLDIYLRKNSTILNTQTFSVTNNPTAFDVNLTTSSVTIAPGDEIYVDIDTDLLECQITGGVLQITYSVTTAVTYDPYEDKYIYK